MKIVTVLNDFAEKGFVEFLRASCEFYKLDAIALHYDGSFFSNRLKDVLFFTYLKQLDDNEIVLFSDAIDAVFVAEEIEILEKFKKFNSNLVFSAEVNCWPDNSLEKDYPGYKHNTHFKYLNSGAFIGRAGYLKKLYQKYPIFKTGDNPSFNWSNQYYWNIIFKKEWPNIQLDYNGEIFYNTAIPTADNDQLIADLKNNERLDVIYAEEKKGLILKSLFLKDVLNVILLILSLVMFIFLAQYLKV